MTAEGVPAEQRLVVGLHFAAAPLVGPVLAEPHVPFAAATGAVHMTWVSVVVVWNIHIQLHDVPSEVTPGGFSRVKEPAHKLTDGAVELATLYAEPHPPVEAEQDAVVPPPEPVHVQLHGPVPPTVEAVPVEHNPAAGALLTATPFAEPHVPFVTVAVAQEVVAKSPVPTQSQVQGPVPAIPKGVPVEHSPVVGLLAAATLFAGPQTPGVPLVQAPVTASAQQVATVPVPLEQVQR